MANRLGVGPATMSRWHRRSVLPAPDLRIGTLDLWMWETVRQWGKQRSRFGKRPTQPAPTPDIVDAAGVADRLAVDARTVENWICTGAFPRPDYRWGTTEAWLWETVEGWSRTSLSQLPQVPPSHAASGPSLSATEVTVTPSRSRDPVGDIERIHRYFAELSSSLATPAHD